ncbi:GTP-binding protein [Natronosporangium hydrolyticum]|uniref:GTP-binding protein n=1 Tax=Natronosporangium hydrolyticum TaxID=2811111 RepID=A0A895Y773_9ACTN|nr:GTP-binding protein [Natronosporangium hydrolyticum]QSB13211.1 GTP-binding protein [Natronosporangium hydrolyticum]
MPRPVAPTATPTAAAADLRPAVTVLSGFSADAAAAVATALLAHDQRLLLVSHDISQVCAGTVRRTVRDHAGVREDERVELVHGCLSCTLREDVLPTLVRLAREHPDRDQVLLLPSALEPEAVAVAAGWCLVDGAPVADAVRFDSYLTVVDAQRLMADLTSSDDLIHRNLHAAPDDRRSVADVVCRQLEYADTVLLWGEAPEGRFETARLAVLLERLVPWAEQLAAADSPGESLLARLRLPRRHDPDTPGVLARGLEGYRVGRHEPAPDCGVVATVFRTRRPFHPQRLHDALEQVTGDALRSRGHLWLASQPELVIGWESAGGGISMGSLGQWLATVPTDQWGEASALRRLTATVDWDPYYGDRSSLLAFIGLDLDPAALHSTLESCLVTDDELALGEQAWRDFPDPFAGCFDADSTTDTETDTDTDTDTETATRS